MRNRSYAVGALGAAAWLSFTTPGQLCAQPALASAGTRVYISVDMEGVAGVVTAAQLSPSGFEYERFRRFMTDEALAAVRAARDAGASEIVVSDSHGNGQNLLVELFPDDVRVVRSWPRHGGMMAGLNSSFDAVLLIGCHASASSLQGVRAHTFSSAQFTRVVLDGKAVGESEFNAAYAGSFGVPVIFAAGDDAALAEMRARLRTIEAVETKRSLGFHSADTITPAQSVRRIAAGVRSALARLREFSPYVVKTPVTLEIEFQHYRPAELLSYLRAVQRVDARTIRFTGRDMLEVSDFVTVITSYELGLTP